MTARWLYLYPFRGLWWLRMRLARLRCVAWCVVFQPGLTVGRIRIGSMDFRFGFGVY